MEQFTHSLGIFGEGTVDVASGRLTIVCKDLGCIGRVFRCDEQRKLTPYGRGWSLEIPKSVRGTLSLSGGRLMKFTDIRSDSYGFFYSSGLLSCVASKDGMVTYDYNADGMLTRVTYPDGSSVSLSYRDIYYIHDISIADKEGRGVMAVSYADYYYSDRIGCVYEYGYDGTERVERAFTEISQSGSVLTLSHRDDILIHSK